MKPAITSPHNWLILDACSVMNLYASKRMAEILTSIAEEVAVAVYVVDVEALTVYRESRVTTPTEKERINLQPLVDTGLLTVVDLESEAEKALFIELTAQRLDDGEAVTAAIAVQRNWAIATDDKIARRLCQQNFPHIQLVSTPELLKRWVDQRQPDKEIIGRVLQDIEARANYLVGPRSPLYSWWQAHKGL